MKRVFFPSIDCSSARRPVRLAAFAALTAFGLAAMSVQAQEKTIELGSLKVSVPSDKGATSELATDELDNVPILRLQFPDTDIEAWRSSLRLEIPAPAAGNYTVVFHAKAEPAECYIDMRVYDFANQPNREIIKAKAFKLEPDWQEFVYDFTIENTETAPVTVTWGGLARANKTLSFRDVKLIKN